MKKCPECGKVFDATWSICLYDDTKLVEAPDASPSDAEKEVPQKQSIWKKPISAKSAELAFGQYFLNRIGVLSLVAGFAFFIAYSFQFIGAWGKLALGFAAAGVLLGIGKHLEKKPGMQWYGFGLIGGGWALGYFATYAMHHIEAVRVITDPHFALLALVFVTSILMVDLFRYRSQAITSLVYLLAFFTAGIGKVTPFSLLYAALLTFSLVAVIYRMKWNKLMILAVLASYLTHAYWLGPEIVLSVTSAFKGTLEMSRFLLSAGFLALYGLLFSIAPLLVHDGSEEDRQVQTVSTLLNSFFFSVFMFQEVSHVNPEWRYWVALGAGAFHILLLYIAKYVVKRDHLVVCHMSLAISFITVSFPLKYTGRWVDIAWIAEIPVLLFLGLYFNRVVYRVFAWGLGFIMTLKMLSFYDPANTLSRVPIVEGYISERSLIVGMGVLFFSVAQFIYLHFKGRAELLEGESAIGRLFYMLALFFLLCVSSLDMHPNLISAVWTAMAVIFFAAGFAARDRWFRYGALSLVCLIVGRIALYDIRDLPTLYRIVLFIGLGIGLLLASFVYGRIALSKDKEILQ